MKNLNFYEGVVENNIDPLCKGRVQIRVPALHGLLTDKESIKPLDLPWALPGLLQCSFYDCGSFLIPPIGAQVYVAPLNNDNSDFLYFGGVIRTSSLKGGSFTEAKEDDLFSGDYNTPDDLSSPKDVFSGREENSSLNRGIIFKSPKGSTIMYDDTSGAESFTIIDRVGQVINMSCPISAADNKGNSQRRGTRSVLTNSQLQSDSFIQVKTGNAEIKATPKSISLDVAGTSILIEEGHLTINAKTVVVNTSSWDFNG